MVQFFLVVHLYHGSRRMSFLMSRLLLLLFVFYVVSISWIHIFKECLCCCWLYLNIASDCTKSCLVGRTLGWSFDNFARTRTPSVYSIEDYEIDIFEKVSFCYSEIILMCRICCVILYSRRSCMSVSHCAIPKLKMFVSTRGSWRMSFLTSQLLLFVFCVLSISWIHTTKECLFHCMLLLLLFEHRLGLHQVFLFSRRLGWSFRNVGFVRVITQSV